MITVEEALILLNERIEPSREVLMEIGLLSDHVLSRDVYSSINMPPFPQSSMDGYAINYSSELTAYEVICEIPAGNSSLGIHLKFGESARIYTGAPVPKGANTIAKQEIVFRKENTITFTELIRIGDNIRLEGEQIKKGELALSKNYILNPASIGFLSGIGIDKVWVYVKPKISILATGSELVKPGKPLEYGKIYESNSFMLKAALARYGYTDVSIVTIEDNFQITKNTLSKLLSENDVVLISGGISVGDYDFVGKSLMELGVDEVFYKVKQKPGKPLYFGKKNKTYVFALPGNPAAALTSFYVYVLSVLSRISGKLESELKTAHVPISNGFINKGDRAQFLKGFFDGNQVNVLEGQSSAMLRSFAQSNALIYIPCDTKEYLKGDIVLVYIL